MNQEVYNPLIDAIEAGDVAAVESLLQTPGVDVDFIFVTGYVGYRYTPLLRAIHHYHKPIIEILLAHGAAVNGPLGAFMTPLQMACDEDNANEDIVNLLIEHGADMDATTVDNTRTPLTLACRKDSNLGTIQLLLDAGADVNGCDGGALVPLNSAAYYGNIETLELLIEAGADVNILSTSRVFHSVPAGSTPLHLAAYKDQSSCLTALLTAGADPNIADANGQTPLHRAALYSYLVFITALLAAGCDPLHQDNHGRTPLQYQYEVRQNRNFSANHFKVITALVAAGDRSWECVPTPCPGLEAAMLSVWQAAPDELPELVKRMENPPQTLIELYARMDDDGEMKKVVQEVLRGLHHHFAGYPEVKEHLLNSIFGFTTV